MNVNRKITVYILATIAFAALFLLPLMGFSAVGAKAGSTIETASSSGDYIFYVVENSEVPLAAAPAGEASAYVLWFTAVSMAIMIFFLYSTWYLSIRRNLGELSERLPLTERGNFNVACGFFHPVRSYRLEKEAEDIVVSRYSKYI